MINIDKLTVSYHDRVVKWQWRLAPAYDLTLCTAGYNGEHATSVNNLGNPTYKDMVTVGVRTKMKEKRCLEIIEEVRSNVGDLLSKNFNINRITKY